MNSAAESQGAYRIDGRSALKRLRTGGATARRDFHVVAVRLPYLSPDQRRSWERDLNAALRATGDIAGLVGSLAGALAFVAWSAVGSGVSPAPLTLLAGGLVTIVFCGVAGKALGAWWSGRVFRQRVTRLEEAFTGSGAIVESVDP